MALNDITSAQLDRLLHDIDRKLVLLLASPGVRADVDARLQIWAIRELLVLPSKQKKI